MLRVAHVSPSFHPAYSYGGPTESSYQLSRFLARAGCEVRVLTTDADGPRRVLDVDTTCELEIESGLRIRYCRRRTLNSVSPELLRRLPGYLRGADVVHINAVYSFPTIPTLFLSTFLDRPVVWSARGALQRWEEVRRPWTKAAWEAICRAAAPRRLAIHFTSTEERDQSVVRFSRALAVVIPNGVLLPAAAPVRAPSKTLRLLAVGRLDPIKGLCNLLLACASLRDRGFGPFTLTLAGTGDREYTALLERRIAELSLGAIVTLPGEVRGEAKTRLFGENDILVAPSFRENFGMAIAEALAHGLPVIAGRGTPWSGLLAHDAGLWVDNDPASLAHAITRAATLPLIAMGARGRAWVARDFAWERVAADMIKVYEQLL